MSIQTRDSHNDLGDLVIFSCHYLVSPGLLNRCSLYCRNEDARPERCRDKRAKQDRALREIRAQDCPNCSSARNPMRFTAEQLATAYPLYKTTKMRENAPWDHEGGYDERPLDPETDQEV